jgi:metal-responsive CopG/Arc/MetJ family transcriptional regulator
MAEAKTKMPIYLPENLARWLRVTAAERGISRSQLILEMVEEAQREDER